MKRFHRQSGNDFCQVAPFAGARVETANRVATELSKVVAPFAGARVETPQSRLIACKYTVAPFAGARVETTNGESKSITVVSRSLRGSAS